MTGHEGQVARSLVERAADRCLDLVRVGRPELDLAKPASVGEALRASAPDIVVNAAAYTLVDQAEADPELAEAVNVRGAESVAAAAAGIGVPVVHLSTDYVFDGSLDRPYREDDPVSPTSVYGRTKLAGERAVARVADDHVILRTAWVYSPFGRNFVRTMLRLAEGRSEVSVVSDQLGSPTSALDLADGILDVCRNLLERRSQKDLRGVFHMAGSGEATWAEVAQAIFERSAELGGPSATVRRITTAEYPTPARRPANSRLDGAKLATVHGVALAPWRLSVATTVARLLASADTNGGPS